MLDEPRDVVQGKPWLQIAKIAGRDLETLLLGDGASPPHPPAQRFIDDRAEGPGCAARFRVELGHHIVIGGERRPHALTLLPRHYDVDAPRRVVTAGRWTWTQPRRSHREGAI